MRKCTFFLLIFGIAAGILIINIPVSTRQGIDFKIKKIDMPLYLKILDFFDRHYNYAVLTKRIIAEANTDKDRVMEIFTWTHQNIKKPVPDLPIVDDHVWYTIVRGYGARDQFSDVFTTLCNYAGIDAYFAWITSKDQKSRLPLSFVNLEDKWYIFDPYYGVWFKDKDNNLADIDTLRSGAGWTMVLLGTNPQIDYSNYFSNLPTIKEIGYRRANLQSPLRRLKFEAKKVLKLYK